MAPDGQAALILYEHRWQADKAFQHGMQVSPDVQVQAEWVPAPPASGTISPTTMASAAGGDGMDVDGGDDEGMGEKSWKR